MDDGWAFRQVPADEPLIPADTVTARYYEEGFATSHFSPEHRRLTGNPPLQQGKVILLLGDSFVEAVGVSDAETTGSQLERIARHAHDSIDVVQYGWPGAPPAKYVVVSRQLVGHWSPQRVIVVLNDDDVSALDGFPRAIIGADSTLVVVDSTNGVHRRSGVRGVVSRIIKTVLRHSTLAFRGLMRVDRWRAPPDRSVAGPTAASADTLAQALPRAVVRSLRRAYGGRLFVVYIARVTPLETLPTLAEQRLLDACASEGVSCVSTREAMTEALIERKRLTRGFMNSVLGEGHLNATGHELVATVIARTVLGVSPPAGTVRTP